jgi:prepilin-type N-terminal cleavage/methylation domain-containing protein
MSGKKTSCASGFTILEISIVVLIAGVVLAFATPKIVNAMREYRLNIAMHQAADLIQRVKTQAVSDNHKASLVVDTGNRRFGIVVYDSSGAVVRTDYMPMPDGITFAAPTGVTAPVSGAPTSPSVSFPAQGGSTTVFQQDFNSRGFPVVAAAGAINALYITNGYSYGVVTVNSVSGIRIFRWEASQWVDLRH